MQNSFRIPLLGGALAATILVAGGFLFWQHRSQEPSVEVAEAGPVDTTVPTWPEGYVRRLSDGVPIPPQEQPKRWYAVMVENSADAWPLSGIGEARLVIEAPVEGSIPRLSAYFDDTQDAVKQIGPVRSLRPYYLDWARGFNAMIAHVGGSPEALATVNRVSAVSLNEFFWGRFFWRSLQRYAPHNVYTSVGLLGQGFEARGYEDDPDAAIPSFTYTELEAAADQRPVSQEITIPFSGATTEYNAVWQYLPDENMYRRFQGDAAFDDADGVAIRAKNIVVLYTTIAVIDDVGRRSIKTVGEGKATLFRDGQAFEARWQKDSVLGVLEFITTAGEPLALNPGQTWIEVLPLSTEVVVEPQA